MKSFANKKLYDADFEGHNLANYDFRSATLIGANFKDADLSYACLEGAQLYGANFEGSKIYRTNFKDAVMARSRFLPRTCFSMAATINCDSVEGMVVNKQLFLSWIYMALTMDVDHEPELKSLKDAIITAMGEETYVALSRMFRERQI